MTLRQTMLDLMNIFLMKIVEKEMWSKQDIINAFHRAMYEVAIYAISNEVEKKEDDERVRNH